MDGEELLVAARRVLEVPDLTGDDDLFDAGMTSLAALRLADALSAILGRDVAVADIYHATTVDGIRQLAVVGEAAEEAPAEEAVVSPAQRRFWLAERIGPGAADNMLVLAYVLGGPLRTDVLAGAFADLVERHPALRTRYHQRGGDIIPEVVPAAGIAIETVAPPPGAVTVDEVAEAVTAGWWDMPFALDRDLPLRARLCRIDAGTHLLGLHIHHIAFDGRSERLLAGDLAALYRARLGSDPAAVPPVGATYADYAARERAAGNDEAELAFWKQALDDAPPPFLPAPPRPTAEAVRHEVVRTVPAATADGLQAAARQRRAPALSTLTAATARAFAEVFGVGGLCLGAITEGRRRAADNAVIGYFVNPLAVPLDGVRDRDDDDLLNHAAARLLGAQRHARTPFDELVRLLRPRRGRHPWYQTLVILQYEPPNGEFAPDVTIRPIRIRRPRTAVEFMVQAFPQPDGTWELEVAWRADGCDDARAVAVADAVVTALGRIAAVSPR